MIYVDTLGVLQNFNFSSLQPKVNFEKNFESTLSLLVIWIEINNNSFIILLLWKHHLKKNERVIL